MADETFLREHLALIRELAEQADPHIKKRLLALAEKYERRLRDQNRTIQTRPLRAHRRMQSPTRCALFPSGRECGCQLHPSTEPVPTNPRPELACSAS